MKTAEEIRNSIDYYIAVRDRAQKERRLRTVEGAQWNIDRCYDELNKLKGSK